jgi:hypothetical protein
MRKIVLTLLLLVSIVVLVSAQDYKTGVGLRAGLSYGLTLKHFVSEKAAFEGLLQSRWSGFDITGLYEIHAQAFEVEKLRWYYGGGAHIGFWNGNYVSWGTPGTSYTLIGIDGILGIEYSFSEAPINIGLDWKPAINLTGYTGFWGDGGALSIRYIF